MSARLVIQFQGTTREAACKDLLTIGRNESNDIVLSDPQVSRHHAMVCRLEQENYYLIDEGSANGSYVNARKISLPTLLRHGDQITIGSAQLCFQQPRQAPPADDGEEGADTVIVTPTVEVMKTIVLVADIRGFTLLSQTIPLQRLTEIMNRWFHEASECIKTRQGVIDKFMGDCVYARWEAGLDLEQSLKATIDAACELDRICSRLNADYPDLPRQLKIGAAVNFGIAALGVDEGTTAIGDTVNLAFRLEEQTRTLGRDMLVSKEAYQYLPEAFWSGRECRVDIKGIPLPVEACALSFAEARRRLRGL